MICHFLCSFSLPIELAGVYARREWLSHRGIASPRFYRHNKKMFREISSCQHLSLILALFLDSTGPITYETAESIRASFGTFLLSAREK